MQSYKVYLVGGAVRDAFLNIPVLDRDWVVTGATPEQLEKQGYQQVGKQFPVFLSPKTKEEYALARREKKQGKGYTGFICDFSPEISLEEDLERRDLTINAIAQDEDGNLIDPFNGQGDLSNRVLRHVSDAFVEDPLRVLRVARFAARFHYLGFTIAPETLELMDTISTSGELASLTPERTWSELVKALNTSNADIFFTILEQVKAFQTLFPGVVWQPSIEQSRWLEKNDFSPAQRWSILTRHTPLSALQPLHQKLRTPNQFKLVSEQVRDFLENHSTLMTAKTWESWLMSVSAIKKPQLFERLVEVLSLITHTPTQEWQDLRTQIAKVNAADLIKEGFSGAELGAALKKARINALSQLTSNFITP